MAVLPPVSAEDIAHILTVAEADLRALSGSRIFLTGGTGFFGTWLLETLAAANARLGTNINALILSRNPEVFAHRSPHLAATPSFTWLAGDVRNFAFPSGTFDFIINGATAASAALNSQSPKEMFSTIVHGTERVLEFALVAGVKNQLFISSGAIYGKQPHDLLLISETYTGGPDLSSTSSAYAEGKRAAELLCAATPDVITKVARCFTFIGPHLPLDTHFAAGNFLRDALSGNNISIHGDGRPLRSYLYAADLVIWLLGILTRGSRNRPYNVGSPNPVSIRELADLVAKHANKNISVHVMSAAGATPPERYVPDTLRALTELNLSPIISLDESIARSLQWLRKS